MCLYSSFVVVVRGQKRFFKEKLGHDPFPSEYAITKAARLLYCESESIKDTVTSATSTIILGGSKLKNVEAEVRSWILDAFESGRLMRVQRDLMEFVIKVPCVS